MNCLEFKRLSLSDPHSAETDFIEHRENCPECLKYVGDIRKMDSDLAASLDVAIPSDLVARLQLRQEMAAQDVQQKGNSGFRPRYAIAASLVVALFVAGFLFNSQWRLNDQIGKDYEKLLAAVVDHMNEQPFVPVWDAERANKTANTLLASYDDSLQLRNMPNLQFSRLCPMGQYRGLHATMQTPDGQITFAYIKGDTINDLLDTAYGGYVTRIKPVRGGNLVIISRNSKSLEQADQELQQAMYWDI